MSYAEHRAKRESGSTNTDLVDHSWEEENVPLLHSGLIENCAGVDGKCVLALSIYYQNGAYRCRIHDRASDEVAFTRIVSLGTFFTQMEGNLRDDELDWTPSRSRTAFK